MYVNRGEVKNCMMDRNHFLVDHAAILLAVCKETPRGGTSATVRYARKQHREIILIDPRTREVTVEGTAVSPV